MLDLVLAIAAGALIGLSLGALGGGGSILAVPVLVYLLDQSAAQATTGSLVVVGTTALIGAIAAHRAGNVQLARGATFGLVAVAGAVLGARASAHVSDEVLLVAFASLMLLVGTVMAWRLLRHRRAEPGLATRPTLDDPIITFSPTFACQCPRALKVLVTATIVGFLTGFLGVGGGFVVVPALLLALALPMEYAAGTALVVITITSAAALSTRAGVRRGPRLGRRGGPHAGVSGCRRCRRPDRRPRRDPAALGRVHRPGPCRRWLHRGTRPARTALISHSP